MCEEALTRTISELRRLFGDDSKSPRVIETIRKHTVVLGASRTAGMVSGPYFYRLIVDGKAVGTRKMVLVK